LFTFVIFISFQAERETWERPRRRFMWNAFLKPVAHDACFSAGLLAC